MSAKDSPGIGYYPATGERIPIIGQTPEQYAQYLANRNILPRIPVLEIS